MDRIRTELIEEDETKRPKNSPYLQQTMRAWSPLLTPYRVAGGYLLIGLIFVPLGAVLWYQANDAVELRYQYDGDGSDGDACKITTYKEGKVCNITFEVEEDMAGPVQVFYELSNFYQNHATYVESVSDDQLQGELTSDVSDDCDPLYQNGSLTLHPCGLIANTLFNDVITVSSGQLMSENGIAWTTDVSEKFAQPEGFVSSACETSETSETSQDCAACLRTAGYTDEDGQTEFDGCDTVEEDNVTYAFYYPSQDDYQYLYETFPEVISPLKGVKDEHFIVWMRTSGLSTFRKLYGRIEDGLTEGEVLSFNVTNNFIVDYFDGTKSLVISTTTSLGSRNTYWGQSLPTVGAIVLVLAILIAVKHTFRPRVMGDITQLSDDT